VTSKLQVTVPKVIADKYRIKPGDEVLWVASGDSVRLVPARNARPQTGDARRLALFDLATSRQKARQRGIVKGKEKERGWTREELYDRGRAR